MDFKEILLEYKGQPITHELLVSILKDYRRPNDKIKALKDAGFIELIKRGLYIPGKATKINQPERGLVANHLYGPSYLSSDSALSHYGLIPERVYSVTSMTTKPSRKFKTTIGLFTYSYLPLPYYAFGLKTVQLQEEQQILMASPEKALFDKIVTTKGILLRSISDAKSYVADLRIDESDLKNFDIAMMSTWVQQAPKKESLEMLIKMIHKL